MKIRIYIIAHKEFSAPQDIPEIYVPLQVGASINKKIGYVRDDTGEHISEKNNIYNELTGQYWAWKNSKEDIIGYCHYRRYFVNVYGKVKNFFAGKNENYLSEKEIEKILKENQMIVHNATYFPETVLQQYERTQGKIPLMIAKRVIIQYYPEYEKAFEHVLKSHKIHLLNMFITYKEIANQYAEWIFGLLEKTEEILRKEYPEFPMERSMGMLAERMLDVWIIQNKISIKECFSINTERIDRRPW